MRATLFLYCRPLIRSAAPSTILAADPPQRTPNHAVEPILVLLRARPMSLLEIEDAFRAYGRRLPGGPRRLSAGREEETGLGRGVRVAVAQTVSAGLATPVHGGERFALTEGGMSEAAAVLRARQTHRERVHQLLRPAGAARNTLAAQVVITAIKVPAALISGSVAQLNDALEEMLDVVASAAVLCGLRFNRERLANIVVVGLMLATGFTTLALALRRLFVPTVTSVTWYPLAVASFSVPFYAIRSAYERDAGVRGGSAALVSQSVDSRNHALVGVAVLVGLIASALGAGTIDTLVGLGLAVAILKSGVILAYNLIRSLRKGEEPDLSQYSPWASDRLARIVQTRLETWFLYIIESEHLATRQELLGRVEKALNPATNPLLHEYGMELDANDVATPALDKLIHRGLIGPTEPFTTTDVGRRHLARALRHRL